MSFASHHAPLCPVVCRHVSSPAQRMHPHQGEDLVSIAITDIQLLEVW